MTDYLECYNFFKDCRAFALKHERFITACKRIREQNEKVDPKLLYPIAELFVDIKREMESTCIEHKCIVNAYDSDVDMESDISSIPESVDSETEIEEKKETDESENETDESDNDTNGSEIDDDMSDDEADDSEVKNEEEYYDDDMADLFNTVNCCIHELIDPFFQAMVETKQTDVIREIQKLNDQYEQGCLRYNDWFSPHEKDECAQMMQEILSHFDGEGTNYFKICESKYIKLLVTYCRDKIDDKEGNKIFNENYEKIIDSEYPLNKKRKMFTKKEYMQEFMNHIAYNGMPEIYDYLEERVDNIVQKLKCT